MALQFCDGFDHYATAQLIEKWSTSIGVSIISPGRFSYGKCAQFSDDYLTRNGPNSGTLAAGAAFNISAPAGTGFSSLIVFQDAGSASCSLSVNSAGALALVTYGASGSTIVSTSGSAVFTFNAWTYVELKATFATTAVGSLYAQLAGQPIINGINVVTSSTANNYANQTRFINSSSSAYLDDVYICDGTGSVNNTFLGDIRVLYTLPAGNGRINQFARTGGTSSGNYTSVNENPPDNDTSYVSSSTPGAIDCYTVGGIGTPTTVVGAQITASARKDDSSSRVLAIGFGNGSTESYNSGVSLPDSYTMNSQPYDINPITGVAWLPNDINFGQIALKVIS